MFLALRRITVLASTIAVTAILSAQNTTSALLSLSSSSSTPGQTITLDLSINSPSSSFQPPATLLWKLTFPPNSVDSIGAISSIPGKVSTCATDVNAGTATCILNGPNRDVIQNGSIAQMRIAVSGRAAGSF